jgi:ribose transport system ATP-binding protein
MSHESALTVSGISKTYAGQPALREVSMSVASGSIHALVGQNGCGKSTLIKILAGVVDPDAGGGIAVAGVSLAPGSPTASDRLGLRFVHQDLGLVSSLDVVDNLALGVGYPRRRTGTINWRSARESARDSLTRLGYSIDVSRPVSELTISERTAVAVARALDPTRSAPTVLVRSLRSSSLSSAPCEMKV